ncbi:MAG: MBL fold metallo-hydrolase, partial [Verrucomicrobiota bacterium]
NGLRLSDRELSKKTGVPAETIKALLKGELDEMSIPKLAPALNLDTNALLRSAMKTWYPRPVSLEGLELFNSRYHSGMTVNSFVVWDPETRNAAIFDTGTDAFPLLDFVNAKSLKVMGLFLTHTHPDHIAEVDTIAGRLSISVHANAREPWESGIAFEEGESFQIGRLSMKTATTWGHSDGGTTYFIEGLKRPVAVVGDAMFAGSMGGGIISYQDALQTNRDNILSLPDETVICPGHGPFTSVREEKRNNPFFPEFKN